MRNAILLRRKETSEIVNLIGCSVSQCRSHLEKQFDENMTWENYGPSRHPNQGWQIDHIRPCKSFNLTCLDQQQDCFHYTNLQPLWALVNQFKGTTIF